MMRTLLLGVRLALAGGSEAVARLVFTVAGVAVGVALLLLAMAGPPAAGARLDRAVWQHAESALRTTDFDTSDDPPAEAPDGALFLVVSDSYDAVPIVRAYVAALGPRPPVPAGLDRLPGPGEVALSPALRHLLGSTSDSHLAARFPGRDVLTIGPAGLAHDLELVAIIGQTPEQLRAVPSAREVRGFYRSGIPSSWERISFQAGLMGVGTVLVLVPVVILIVVVSRVAWRQRERRLAAIRLVGATRAQITLLSAAETGFGALLGAGLGWLLYEAGRRVIAATVVFQGGHFWLDDLAAPRVLLATVLAGVPLLAILTAVASLRQVHSSALSAQRRGRLRRPSAWTAVPLAVGLGGQFALVPLASHLPQSTEDAPSVASGLASFLTLLTLVGFVVMGPWLVMMVGRGIARLSRSVPALLAARRIAADPHATFRSVSAVVLAAMAVTFSGSIINVSTPPAEPFRERLRPGVIVVDTGAGPEQAVASLLTEGAVAMHTSGGSGYVPCAELARVRLDVTCPYPADVEEAWLVEPDPDVNLGLPIRRIYIPTDGSVAAESRARTAVAAVLPNAVVNSDRAPIQWDFGAAFVDFDRLFRIAAGFVLIVGAFGLTASMVGGLIERRRPFALLRATGVQLAELRRTVLLETAATMAVASIAGAAVGLLLAYASVQQSTMEWRWPGLEVAGVVGGGIFAALVFSMIALPLLALTTRHDTIRYE